MVRCPKLLLLREVARASLVAIVFAAGCSARPEPREEVEREPTVLADGPESAGGGGTSRPTAHRVEVVAGVPDRGRDPAVVAVRLDGGGLCSGSLISPRLVLTARHCLHRTVSVVACPASGVQVFEPRPPGEIGVFLGEDVVSAREAARAVEVVAPAGVTLCDADIAIVVLDVPVTAVRPLPVRARGPAAGDHLRSVGFGRPGGEDPGGSKLVREHLDVLGVASAEFTIGEATCRGDAGGPAIDEDTGEIVGVLARGGPACEGEGVHNVYTRVDAYAWLFEEAFARVVEIDVEERADAGAENPAPKPARRGTKHKPPSDVGGPCETGHDCAAGVCITDAQLGPPADGGSGEPASGVRRYCSRPCGPGDRCMTRYHCKRVAGIDDGSSVCLNVR